MFTSILKDDAEKAIPKTSAVPKLWFSDTCKDAIKECNKAHDKFKREPSEGNMNAYRIARAKDCRDIRQSERHLGEIMFPS